ncbi:MAG: hypothetical protein JJT82_06645 [Legionellaceae bacterium]|nr:hypothetical protein [Legionellaceae bacterium]
MFLHSGRQSSVLALFLTASSLSFAGTMGTGDDSTGWSFSVTPIYGAISDSAIDKAPYAVSIDPSNNIVSNVSKIDSRWGYSLSLGYLFGPENSHDVVLSYTNLTNKGTSRTINTQPDDVLINPISQILKSESGAAALTNIGGLEMYGPAEATFSGNYKYQTADLITHRYFKSSFLSGVQFSRYYGIKATQLKKGFVAQYRGMGYSFDPVTFETTLEPLDDNINYQAKYYGIGPRIGMGANWALTHHISLIGDVSAALLGGTYDTRFHETLVTSINVPDLVNSDRYSFNQKTHSSLWAAGVLGANLGVAVDFDMKNDSHVGIAGGISSEQYWTEATPDYFSSKTGRNHVSINQRFSVRNLFIKLSYAC